MIKHGPGANLDDLDFEAVDKEIEVDEAAQAAQATVTTSKDPPEAEKDGDGVPPA